MSEGERAVFADNARFYATMAHDDALPFRDAPEARATAEHVTRFEWSERVAVESTAVKHYDFLRPRLDLRSEHSRRSESERAPNGKLDVFDYRYEINVGCEQSDTEAVDTLFHETYHVEEGHENVVNAQEYETEVATAEYLLKHGFPKGRPKSRKRDASGKEVIDHAELRKFVDQTTPRPSSPSPAGRWVSKHNPTNNNAILDDNSERPPRAGDFYVKEQVIPRGPVIDVDWLTCPAPTP